MEYFEEVTLELVVAEIDVFAQTTGEFEIIALEHLNADERQCRRRYHWSSDIEEVAMPRWLAVDWWGPP